MHSLHSLLFVLCGLALIGGLLFARFSVQDYLSVPALSHGDTPWTQNATTQTQVKLNKAPVKKPLDTTVVVTTSLIPSHPSVLMLNHTLTSVNKNLWGLHPDYPLIITFDGIKNPADASRYEETLQNMHAHFPNALILTHNTSIGSTRNIKAAIHEHVETEFLYLIQHDLVFSRFINHTAMVMTFHQYPQDMNVVRFNLRQNRYIFSDRRYPCFGMDSPLNFVNGIHFTKTGHWSDK